MKPAISQVHQPRTYDEATGLLQELGEQGGVVGGGTWIMRAQLRREALKTSYVTLAAIPDATAITRTNGATRVGAAVTHAQLAALNGDSTQLGAVMDAARVSGFPAIRNVATIAGNLSTPLPEVDLVPALLATDCVIEVIDPAGAKAIPIEEYVPTRTGRPSTEVVKAVEIPSPANRRSAYERLTVLDGGGYGVASVAVSVDLDGAKAVVAARVAVGAVEEVPRRAPGAEVILREQGLNASSADLASAVAAEFTGRDGLDAPGWYRLAVLPVLFERVLTRITTG